MDEKIKPKYLPEEGEKQMPKIDYAKLEENNDSAEESDIDITKVKWLDDIEIFNATSVWSMWWVLMHAVREILVRLRGLDK